MRSRAAWYSASRSARGFAPEPAGLALPGVGLPPALGRLRMRIGPLSTAVGTTGPTLGPPPPGTMSGIRFALLADSHMSALLDESAGRGVGATMDMPRAGAALVLVGALPLPSSGSEAEESSQLSLEAGLVEPDATTDENDGCPGRTEDVAG